MSTQTSILISVKPEYVDLIFQGKKTVELRRRFAESLANGSKVYIYSTSPVKRVIGYVLVKAVVKKDIQKLWESVGRKSCVSYDYFNSYFEGLEEGYGILIERPVPLKKQISLDELRANNYIPPQSYMFVSDDLNRLLMCK